MARTAQTHRGVPGLGCPHAMVGRLEDAVRPARQPVADVDRQAAGPAAGRASGRVKGIWMLDAD